MYFYINYIFKNSKLKSSQFKPLAEIQYTKSNLYPPKAVFEGAGKTCGHILVGKYTLTVYGSTL